MIRIANAQFWVHDLDEALSFYTRTVGWEVQSDVTVDEWSFRWLVVGPPGQPDVGLVLMPVPGPPMLDAESPVPGDRRLPRRIRRARGPGRRLQRPAHGTALRYRHVVPRPFGQQHPAHAGARVLDGTRAVSTETGPGRLCRGRRSTGRGATVRWRAARDRCTRGAMPSHDVGHAAARVRFRSATLGGASLGHPARLRPLDGVVHHGRPSRRALARRRRPQRPASTGLL